MAWLFERTIEAAAWVAMIAAWLSLGWCLYSFYLWCGVLDYQPIDNPYLTQTAHAAGAFAGFALALGGLACVDRFLFDADQK